MIKLESFDDFLSRHSASDFFKDCRKPYNLRKLDDMSLAILKVLSRLRSSGQAARSKYLWEAYLSKSFPDCTYKQMMSRIQKLSRARLVIKYYRENDFMFERAYWKVTEEGLLRISSSPEQG